MEMFQNPFADFKMGLNIVYLNPFLPFSWKWKKENEMFCLAKKLQTLLQYKCATQP